MFTPAQREQAKRRAAEATRAHYATDTRASENFDWDEAIELLKATFNKLDNDERKRRRERNNR